MQSSIFRAYDIRGVVDKQLTAADVILIGKALGSSVREQGGTQMVVARDGRESSPVFIQALTDGILSVGCDVIDIGIVPTPLLYYATHIFDQHSGAMITGSHNPAEYNGVKMVVNGKTLSEAEIKQLYQRILDKQFTEGVGTRYESEIVERYISHITESVHLKRPLKIVIDAGNGVAGVVAPHLFRALGCEVHELFCEVDGRFPNHHPDPSQAENLQDLIKAVREQQAEVGLAFDGDGDRLGVVTSTGEMVSADRLLMLLAKALLKTCPQAKIIYDIKCTNQLGQMVSRLGGEPIIWKTGHSLIKAKMIETQAQLAGEMSGHIFFKDRWYGFDDALYAGVRLLEILSQQAESASLFAEIPNSVNTPELKVAVADTEKFDLMEELIRRAQFSDPNEVMTIDGLRVNFEEGWGLVRPSNTTPYLVLRFEAINELVLKRIQTAFRDWMLSVKPDLVLPF